jgi:large subunit ribosomal protein L18
MKRIIKFKRRMERKTNYRKRLALLKSGKVRLVIRKSLSNISVQLVNFNPSGDQTVASAVSSELKKFGWTKTGNIPAAYLTGLLAGKKAKEKNVKEAILDLGVQTSTKGSRIYAALKGVIDAGIDIPHSKDILPSEDRINGKHISEEISKQFDDVKKKIGV